MSKSIVEQAKEIVNGNLMFADQRTVLAQAVIDLSEALEKCATLADIHDPEFVNRTPLNFAATLALINLEVSAALAKHGVKVGE